MSEVQGAPAPAATAAPAVPPATTAPAPTAPAAAAPAVAAPPAAAPAATPPASPNDTVDPAWIADRLARNAKQERAKVLAELGITDPVAAKKALDDARAAEDAKKSQDTRIAEMNVQLTAEKAEKERLAGITREHAGRMIGVLTAEQQAAVRALAPDTDPAGQLNAIHVLGPTWAKAADAAPAATPPAAAAPVAPAAAAPPVSTAPGATAPTGGAPTSPPDHRAVYQQSRATNPFAAAAYGLEHASEVYKSKK